jgi:hypothetical protein
LAICLAEGSRGQGKKHLLTHHILKQQPTLCIVPYFGLIFRNGAFSGVGIRTFGSEDEVKPALYWNLNRLHAAGTEHFKVRPIVGADSDIVYVVTGSAMLNQQVGLPGNLHGSYLPQVQSVLQHPWCNRLCKLQRFIYELYWGNQHNLRVAATAKRGNASETVELRESSVAQGYAPKKCPAPYNVRRGRAFEFTQE